jgi:hypothetical protein
MKIRSADKGTRFAFAMLVFTAMFLGNNVWADTVGPLNVFNSGETALASEVNGNFEAVAAAVNGNDALVGAVTSRVSELEGQAGVAGPQGERGVPGPEGKAAPNLELVGFSSALRAGDAGVLSLTLVCQEQFAESRMCTSVEVMETVNVPEGLAGAAWVRPVFVPSMSSSTNGYTKGAEASGVYSRNIDDFSCVGWAQSGSTNPQLGLTVDARGRFGGNDCEVPIAVACCRQVE